MAFTIRQTLPQDVEAAERALEDGKAALAALDIPQWQGEYPDRIDIEDDTLELDMMVSEMEDQGATCD